jgi:hypothetical protein
MGPLHWVRTLFRTNSPYHASNGILTHLKNMATVSGVLTVTSHVAVDITSLEWRVSISTKIWSLTKRTKPASHFVVPTGVRFLTKNLVPTPKGSIVKVISQTAIPSSQPQQFRYSCHQSVLDFLSRSLTTASYKIMVVRSGNRGSGHIDAVSL